MTSFLSLRRWLSGFAAFAAAGILWNVAARAEDPARQTAQVDCYSIGMQIAQENGGTLARAASVSRGDARVCLIVVLVPGKDGERPRRAEFEVPAQ
ncbi:MAG: hypothetical protein INR68_04530 [Methylobacterium mesophilicum]|nr:hypothetical protein [Methylobacterium mesophilicum]